MTEQNEYEKTSKYFKEKKYVIVDAAMPAEQCKELTDYLLDLVEKNKTKKDRQCPLSESIYGDPVMDALLEDMKPIMEKATGLRLYPTYSYARKYAPGDELKPHLDRESCEISATLTLGFEGEVWPIHVSTDDNPENDIGEILMKPGDMVVYRGMEINHWREPYTQGNWQCQVFLHYVDADGPHKDLKYDKREKLGTTSKVDETSNMTDSNVWIFGIPQRDKFLYMQKENVLSAPLIDTIVSYTNQIKLDQAQVGGENRGRVDKKIRNVSHCWLPFDRFEWLYRLVETEIRDMNWINFKFKLDSMEMIDFLEYHEGKDEHDDEHGHGKYTKHIDGSIHSTRKLTFSIQLSDPSEYEGGELLLWGENTDKPFVANKQKGSITFFPSYILHEVTPVTKGTRRSIVSWIHGPHLA